MKKTPTMIKNYDNYSNLSMAFYARKSSQKAVNDLYRKDESFKRFADAVFNQVSANSDS